MDIKTFFQQPEKMTEAMRDIVTFITHELKKMPTDTKFCECVRFLLPIHQLFGINVTCRITIYNHNNDGATYFHIESDRFYGPCDDNEAYTLFSERINGKNIIEKIHKIIEILQNFKLDAYNGRFGIMNDEHLMHRKSNIAWEQLLNSHSHITTISGECCVCLTRTRTKTACNHSICIECAEKIVKDDDCIPCPLCRKDITYGLTQ